MQGARNLEPLWRAPAGAVAALARAQATNVRQGFGALLVASVVNLGAGLTLGLMTGTLQQLPGLIILVPAAIALRGNVFGALGSRLGTAVHTGQWEGDWSGRPAGRSVVGQNLAAAAALTLHLSVALAFLARGVAALFDLPTISLLDFLTVSVVGGVLASAVVLVITVVVAVLSVRRGWDMDNVSAPVVTSAGDVVTIPSLWLATLLLPIPYVRTGVAVLSGLAVAAAVVHVLRRPALRLYRRMVAEGIPILLAAGTVDVLAGITIDRRMDELVAFPALLVLVPPLLADAGAIGAILSARLSSKLHLGFLAPRLLPGRAAAGDVTLAYLLAVPVFAVVGLGATLAAVAGDLGHPGWGTMLGVTMIAGLISTTGAVLAGYYGAVVSYRFGLDPDTYGIPSVTASMDLLGVLALLAALFMLGVAG